MNTGTIPRWVKDGTVKVKVQLELNLVRNAKNSKKRIYRHVGQKRKIEENALPLP